MKEGKCIQCESDQHVIAECAEYAKIQAENRKRVEAQGKRWISWEEKKAQQQAKNKPRHVQVTRRVESVVNLPLKDNEIRSRTNTDFSEV